jgi:hypothetical protein
MLLNQSTFKENSMGVYWTVVCDERKEYIEPHALKGQGAKGHEITAPHSDFGRLTLIAAMYIWSDCKIRLVPEFDGYEYDDERGYKDVSLRVIEEANRFFGTKIEADPNYVPAADENEDSDEADEEEA